MTDHMPRLIVVGVVAAIALFATVQTAAPGHHGAHVVVPPGESGPRVGPSYLYPDPNLTPGVPNLQVSQANIQQTICVRGWTATIRPSVAVTNKLKSDQLAGPYATRYATDKNATHYEEDHFISLELGGNPTDPKNLWPEMWGTPAHPLTSSGPFPSDVIGAKAKDAVENELHKEVCAGRLPLKEAQDIISTDWFKFYRDHLVK